MKSATGLLRASVLILGIAVSSRASEVLGFDDLSPGPSGSSINIPNGYGELQWQGFGVINGAVRPATEGYHTGMVSPDNVAFNDDDINRTASISSSTLFNFNSAYLTAAFNYVTSASSNGVPTQIKGMQVEIKGLVANPSLTAATLKYDNTYVLSAAGPLFADLNYAGVNSVVFIPELPGSTTFDNNLIFVMDNASTSLPDNGGSLALMGLGLMGLCVVAYLAPMEKSSSQRTS